MIPKTPEIVRILPGAWSNTSSPSQESDKLLLDQAHTRRKGGPYLRPANRRHHTRSLNVKGTDWTRPLRSPEQTREQSCRRILSQGTTKNSRAREDDLSPGCQDMCLEHGEDKQEIRVNSPTRTQPNTKVSTPTEAQVNTKASTTTKSQLNTVNPTIPWKNAAQNSETGQDKSSKACYHVNQHR